MIKNMKMIKEIGAKISSISEKSINNVFKDYSRLEGREEEITAQIRGEINRHLIENIEHELNGLSIRKNCKILVSTFRKTQEKKVGADLAVILDIEVGGKSVSKAFLVQAKVAENYGSSHSFREAKIYSQTLIEQCKNMLAITSDAFVFLYSSEGLYCIPAFQIILNNSPSLKTENIFYHKAGVFFEEFFKCFVGDHLISPSAFGLEADNLEEYAEKITAESVLKFKLSITD